MATPPATQTPSMTPAEMQILVSRTGLVLNPGQVADLVLAWRQIAGLIGAMPRGRPMGDDMALSFRLAPPAPPPAAPKRVAKPKPKAAAKRVPLRRAAPRR
jgi:hypothetical protein